MVYLLAELVDLVPQRLQVLLAHGQRRFRLADLFFRLSRCLLKALDLGRALRQ